MLSNINGTEKSQGETVEIDDQFKLVYSMQVLYSYCQGRNTVHTGYIYIILQITCFLNLFPK